MGTGLFGSLNDLFSLLAPGLPYWMFSNTVPENRYTSCWTKPIWSRRDFKVTSWIFSPIDEDTALVHIVKAGDQIAKGGFAATGRAHQGHVLPGIYMEVDVGQHLLTIVRIGETHIFKGDLPFFLDLQVFGAPAPSKISTSASITWKNRSTPVMPCWNCSANCTSRRIEVIRVPI